MNEWNERGKDWEVAAAERSGAGATSNGQPGAGPDPEVPQKARRRKFTAEYKWRVLVAADACKAPGELGALLRREGLFSSHLTSWRKHRKAGSLRGLTPKKRGRKSERHPLQAKVEQLQRQNQQLLQKLEQAQILVEFQKKACDLLGIPLQTPLEGESNS